MKILYLLGGYFPSQLGGPNNTVHWQAKYLAKEGVDVTVASISVGLNKDDINKYSIELNESNTIEGVEAYYFDYLCYESISPKLYLWLIRNIKKFDFIQLTSYFYPMTWAGALLCKFYKIPFSIAPRGELEDNAFKFNNKIKKFLHFLFLNRLYSRSSFMLVTSKQELSFCKKYFREMNFELIPNYIDLERNLELDELEITSKKDILYLGRIHPKKGIENLIEAYISLDEKFTSQHSLLIAGGGKDKYIRDLIKLTLKSRYTNKIKFLGHLQGEDKAALYKKSKVFVLPSYSENFGNVVLESLSYSTPVIASIYTPWRELQDNGCGFCVDNKPEEIKNALECILGLDANRYSEYCINSINFVSKEYDIKTNVTKILSIYSKHI